MARQWILSRQEAYATTGTILPRVLVIHESEDFVRSVLRDDVILRVGAYDERRLAKGTDSIVYLDEVVYTIVFCDPERKK